MSWPYPDAVTHGPLVSVLTNKHAKRTRRRKLDVVHITTTEQRENRERGLWMMAWNDWSSGIVTDGSWMKLVSMNIFLIEENGRGIHDDHLENCRNGR